MPAKAGRWRRLLALLVDLLAAGALTDMFPGYGRLFGALYLFFRDAVGGGRGLGKLLAGVRAAKLPDMGPVSWKDSLLRNLTLGISWLLPPAAWSLYSGKPLLSMAAVAARAAVFAEIYFGLIDPDGRRLGDRWAGTAVVRAGGDGAPRGICDV